MKVESLDKCNHVLSNVQVILIWARGAMLRGTRTTCDIVNIVHVRLVAIAWGILKKNRPYKKYRNKCSFDFEKHIVCFSHWAIWD